MLDHVEGDHPDARAVGVLLGGRRHEYSSLERRRHPTTCRQRGGYVPRPDDPINIQHMSVSTGIPKGATVTHRNILNPATSSTRLQPPPLALNWLCIPVPFYHCFGMVMGEKA